MEPLKAAAGISSPPQTTGLPAQCEDSSTASATSSPMARHWTLIALTLIFCLSGCAKQRMVLASLCDSEDERVLGAWSGYVQAGDDTYVTLVEAHELTGSPRHSEATHILYMILRLARRVDANQQYLREFRDGVVMLGQGLGPENLYEITSSSLLVGWSGPSLTVGGSCSLQELAINGSLIPLGAPRDRPVLTLTPRFVQENPAIACSIWSKEVVRHFPRVVSWNEQSCVGQEDALRVAIKDTLARSRR